MTSSKESSCKEIYNLLSPVDGLICSIVVAENATKISLEEWKENVKMLVQHDGEHTLTWPKYLDA